MQVQVQVQSMHMLARESETNQTGNYRNIVSMLQCKLSLGCETKQAVHLILQNKWKR